MRASFDSGKDYLTGLSEALGAKGERDACERGALQRFRSDRRLTDRAARGGRHCVLVNMAAPKFAA
jgi:hypothetical protein